MQGLKEEKKKTFCKSCGLRLDEPIGVSFLGFTKVVGIEFSDGWMCQKCYLGRKVNQ